MNYHKLWDNLPALLVALGLPLELAASFPKRAETVRRAPGQDPDGAATRAALRVMYKPLIEEIMANPAVLIV